MEYLTIKEMPEDARPRERLERSGPGALSNQELLAITLSTGVVKDGQKYTAIDLATQLLRHFESLKGSRRLILRNSEKWRNWPGQGLSDYGGL